MAEDFLLGCHWLMVQPWEKDLDPHFHTRVECVPTCRPERGEQSYPPCTAGGHVAEMIRRSYARAAE